MLETFVTTPVGKVRTLRSGPASAERAVLCWPGMGLTAEEFHQFLREGDARGVAVLAVDPPGHGRSDPAPGIEWADVAAIVRDVAAALPAAHLLLVGHTAGATALLFGAQGLPRRVAGIVLGDGGFLEGAQSDDLELRRQNEEWYEHLTYPDWDTCMAAARSELNAWNTDIEAGILDLFATTREGKVRPRGDLETMIRWAQLLRDYRPQEAPALSVPALALWATEVQSSEPAGIAALRDRLPRLQAQCLVGSGHELFWDQPEAASLAVWNFFDAGCRWQDA